MIITTNRNELNIPNEYQKLDALPDDPKDMVVYGKQNNQSFINIMMMPIALEEAMPINMDDLIVDSVHGYLNDKQGLIEVKSGLTTNNTEYVYTIVKDLDDSQHDGVMYFLTFQFKYPEYVLNIQGMFQEIGTTGIRDSVVYAECLKNGSISGLKGWMKDPYDVKFKNGILMNLSEKEDYDEMFEEHPLTECRKFINYLIDNN